MLHWFPESVSTYGGDIDHVIRTIYYIVGAWLIVSEAVLFWLIFRYRKSPNRAATYQAGTTLKAMAWVLVPVVVILGFDFAIDIVQAPVWKNIKQTLPIPEQIVRVKGRQFVWEMTQAGADGSLDTPDDIPTLNELTVPVHTKVVFELQSADVIHSLWIPNLRLKQDAVPGRTIRGWFEATREGDFPIACAELCGSGHGTMKATLHVLGKADYQNWLEANKPEVTSRAQ